MSRSGYTDDFENEWPFIRWRGAVTSSIRGRRGQAFLKELLKALDAMPSKRLTTDALQRPDVLLDSGLIIDGPVCALGQLGRYQGLNLAAIDAAADEDDDWSEGAVRHYPFDAADALLREIVYLNDEIGCRDTDEARWRRMRDWVRASIKQAPQ